MEALIYNFTKEIFIAGFYGKNLFLTIQSLSITWMGDLEMNIF